MVLPLAVDLDVVVVVSPSKPSRLLPFGKGNRLKDVPSSFGLVAIYLDHRIHHQVHGKRERCGCCLDEKLANRLTAAIGAKAAAFPDGVFGEAGLDSVWI